MMAATVFGSIPAFINLSPELPRVSGIRFSFVVSTGAETWFDVGGVRFETDATDYDLPEGDVKKRFERSVGLSIVDIRCRLSENDAHSRSLDIRGAFCWVGGEAYRSCGPVVERNVAWPEKRLELL